MADWSPSFTKEIWDVLLQDPRLLKDWLANEAVNNPFHVAIEILSLFFILYLWRQKPFKPGVKPPGEEPTSEEKEELIASWVPQKGCDQPPADLCVKGEAPVVKGLSGGYIDLEGIGNCIDLGTFNYLGMATRAEVVDAALEAVDHYGVGSCGPRGFYGTVQPHIVLEEQLKQVYDRPNAIIYSFQYTTLSSIIPAFSSRQDILVVDKGVSMSILNGVELSRSKVYWFEHNDMADLEKQLRTVAERQGKRPTRRWIVVEGVYRNHGDVCRLPETLKLKEKYKFRIMLDDSFSAGALGKNGRGIVEEYNLPPSSVEVYTSSMDSALGSTGGFCVGEDMVVDHQRLSSTGYCFSASLPPFAAVAASRALEIMLKEPELVRKMRENTEAMRDTLRKEAGKQFVVKNSAPSPIFHLTFHPDSTVPRARQEQVLSEAVAELARTHKIAVVRPQYTADERFPPPASIRLTASGVQEVSAVKAAAKTVAEVVASFITKA